VTRDFAFSLLAAGLYAVGAVGMKSSDGLRLLLPSVLLYGCFVLGATFQALAFQHQEVGAGNTVVLGIEAIGSFVLGVIIFHEVITPVKLVAIALVAAGVYLLRQ
jgi:quaternary ammonium compound-resistance protein SugE